MSKEQKPQTHLEEETPSWLKSIQLNSWEAELLISALFLYILFQIPDILHTYRKVHFDSTNIIYRLITFFEEAVTVLSIGYVVHIITRGIWVANIGLSYVFPKGIDLEKVGLKNKFRKELENSKTMDYSVLLLERIASITYAISFMCSGLVLSVGAILTTIILYVEWCLQPSIDSGIGWVYFLSLMGMFLYLLVLLIVFIDFLTNGFFRRDSWASKPYYYIVLAFRFITLSFVYNRMLLVIISNLSKWKAHLVPVGIVMFLVLYFSLGRYFKDREVESYYEGSFDNVRYENFENLRHEDSRITVTIQNDIIENGVLKLYVRELVEFKNLHQHDPSRTKDWRELSQSDKVNVYERLVGVKLDDQELDSVDWKYFKNPLDFSYGFLTYLDINDLKTGQHTLIVELDTSAMIERQKNYLAELQPSRQKLAKIPFFKTD